MSELEQVKAERDRLMAIVLEYEEREAAVCPEDVGFEEVIAGLNKRAAKAEAEVARLTARWAKLAPPVQQLLQSKQPGQLLTLEHLVPVVERLRETCATCRHFNTDVNWADEPIGMCTRNYSYGWPADGSGYCWQWEPRA